MFLTRDEMKGALQASRSWHGCDESRPDVLQERNLRRNGPIVPEGRGHRGGLHLIFFKRVNAVQ